MTILKHADFEVPAFGEFANAPVAVPGYTAAINALSPVAYWRCGELSGTTLSDEVGTHPLTLTGAYALGQPGALQTDADKATRFDSAEATSSGPVLPGGTGDPFSIVFWVRRFSDDGSVGQVMRQFVSATTGHVRLLLLGDDRVRYFNVGEPNLYSTQTISTDWRMVVFTRSSSGVLSFYLDGAIDSTVSGGGTAIASVPFNLGQNAASPPDILLDEVAIFDEELTQEQARWLYGLGSGELARPEGY